jgi:hypothetical protein
MTLSNIVNFDTELALMRSETADLVEILTWRRPHNSAEEKQFTVEWIDKLALLPSVTAFDVDGFGNRWVTVGAGSPLLFSCHIDTVSARGGRQAVGWAADDAATLGLVKPKPGRSLGADDGAGLWMMRRMIAAGVAGSYVFHRGEEKGRLGSCWVAENEPERLDGFKAVIAFDRKGTSDFITHQMDERGCSVAFVDSFTDELADASDGLLRYQADDTGSYTDSYSYFELVSECCNMSIGYQGEHGPRETLDARHIWRLCNALIALDWSKLVFERDCTVTEYNDLWRGDYSGGWSSAASYGNEWDRSDNEADDRLERLCHLYPETAAQLLEAFGVGFDEFCDELTVGDLEGGALN